MKNLNGFPRMHCPFNQLKCEICTSIWLNESFKVQNSSFNVSSMVFMYVLSMLSLGCIVISDLVVVNLFMHSLSGMILLYLAAPFFTVKVFLHEIT